MLVDTAACARRIASPNFSPNVQKGELSNATLQDKSGQLPAPFLFVQCAVQQEVKIVDVVNWRHCSAALSQ